MPVTADSPAPYAPASAILSVLTRHRTKGLPPVVDLDVLTRAGVSATLAPRTLHALRSLDLIGEDGRISDTLEGLRLAPEAEYQQRLADWLRSAYADVLTYVDPETASEVELRDAFRTYVPTGQQTRMVSLFQSLFAAAGLAPERQRQTPKRPTGATGAARQRVSPGTARLSAIKVNAFDNPPPPAGRDYTPPDGIPPALAGLLASLPKNGQWTQSQRDKFMTAFPVILDFAFEIVPDGVMASKSNENGD